MKTKRYLSRLVSMLLVCSMLVSMIPVMVLPASAAEQGKVLEDVTLTAESTASTNRTVSGTGNKVLTFTAAITDPDKTLKANIKMYRDPGEGEGTSKIEVLRFKLDRGNIKLSDLSKTGSSINYTTMAPYDDGKTYSLKLVLLPAGADTPATVKLYQVDGQTESQLGEDLEMPAGVTLEELTRLSFAVDSNSSVGASVTFSNMVYATGVDLGGSETPEEPGDETVIFSQDFEGEVAYQGDHTGSDVAEPTTTGETSNVLELTDLDKVDYPAIDKLCFSADTANVAAFTVDDLGIWAGDLGDKPADMYAKRFSDVPVGHWAKEAISYASGKGLLNGVGNGAFDPEATTTRATLVTILARLDGVDTNGGETWYSKGTDWAVSKGISDGTNPDAPISREQFVTMLYRYAGQPAVAGNALGGFADGQAVSDWAIPAMEWAVATGLMTGRTDGTLDPTGTATRAEAAALLMRYCQKGEAGR